MTDVFISYKREDRNYARKIAELLVERGYDVWWDIELLPGDRFADEINEILSNAKVVIVLWTPESIRSNWVKSEASIALSKDILIPICLRSTNIPAPFNTLHSLDLTSWNGVDANAELDIVIKAIEKRIGSPIKTEKVLSAQEVDNALEKSQQEVEFWKSITSAAKPTIDEYQLYIETYGEMGSFTKLAYSRINDLKESSNKGPRFRGKFALASIIIGIVVGGFTIANMLGMFEADDKMRDLKNSVQANAEKTTTKSEEQPLVKYTNLEEGDTLYTRGCSTLNKNGWVNRFKVTNIDKKGIAWGTYESANIQDPNFRTLNYRPKKGANLINLSEVCISGGCYTKETAAFSDLKKWMLSGCPW